jgi:hypothetical protein
MTGGRIGQEDWRNSGDFPRRQIRAILPRSGLLEQELAADPPSIRGVHRFVALLTVGGTPSSAVG